MPLSRFISIARTIFGFIAALGLLLGLNVARLPSLNLSAADTSDRLPAQAQSLEQIDNPDQTPVK